MGDAWGGSWGTSWGLSWTRSADAAAVAGGYTPFAAYDPGASDRLERRRRKLRKERAQLRADIERLVRGDEPQPEVVRVSKKLAKGKRKVLAGPPTTATPKVPEPATEAAARRLQALEARRSRLEAVQNEMAALGRELEALHQAAAQARQEALLEAERREDDERRMLLLLMS